MNKEDGQKEYPFFDIDGPIQAPTYSLAIDWMKNTRGRRVSFDIWARGNYTRRILHNRAKKVFPLLVRVENTKEMSWAYKRLALLDIPIEFIYAGHCEKAKVLHHYPSDISIDAGWGYVAALGPPLFQHQGREYFSVIGNAKLMPEEIIDWVVDEVAQEFMQGKVFVAPAELVGLDKKASFKELSKHSVLTGGSTITEGSSESKTILELGIPFIDNLKLADFNKFINDYADHLVSFRKAFHDYVAAKNISEAKGKELLKQLKYEIEDLLKSDSHIPFKNMIGVIGGILGLTAASIAATTGEISSVLALSGAALSSMKGAADAHQYIRDKLRNKDKRMNESPYAVFWKLGMTKPNKFKPERKIYYGPAPKQTPADFNENSYYHWLCPPTVGMGILAFKK
jgi:hypothetical protein